jgi:integrase
VLNVAHKEWLAISRVPRIQNTKEHMTRTKVYTPGEERKILDLCAGDMHSLVCVLVDTGMRLGEALRFTPNHVDWSRRLIVLSPDITKSSKPRAVPMTRRVREILYGRPTDEMDLPYFRMKLDHVEKQWQKIRLALKGDTQWVLHAFRHTYASRMVQAGVDLYTVKELLGHSTIAVTERYAHLNPKKLIDAVKVLEAVSAQSTATEAPGGGRTNDSRLQGGSRNEEGAGRGAGPAASGTADGAEAAGAGGTAFDVAKGAGV